MVTNYDDLKTRIPNSKSASVLTAIGTAICLIAIVVSLYWLNSLNTTLEEKKSKLVEIDKTLKVKKEEIKKTEKRLIEVKKSLGEKSRQLGRYERVIKENLTSSFKGVLDLANLGAGFSAVYADKLTAEEKQLLIPALSEALAKKGDQKLQKYAALALGKMGGQAKQVVPKLIELIEMDEKNVINPYLLDACVEIGKDVPSYTEKFLKGSKIPKEIVKQTEERILKSIPPVGKGLKPEEIQISQTPIQGELKKGDSIDELRSQLPQKRIYYAMGYRVNFDAQKTFIIDLMSKDFDPYLRIEDNKKNSLAWDDDSGKGLNARIVFQPLKETNNPFLLIATTFVPGAVGKFTLNIRQTELEKTWNAFLPDNTKDKDTKRGNAYFNTHAMPLKENKTYLIDLKSSDFDAYLKLTNSEGKLLAEDDDSGDGFNSRIYFTPRTSSKYNLIATSFLPSSTGRYELQVWEVLGQFMQVPSQKIN